MPDKANSLHSTHSPRTQERPHACSIGRRLRTAPVQSNEEGESLIVGHQLRAPARQGKQCVLLSHRRAAASLLDGSPIRDSSGARQRGSKRQPWSASTSCECQLDKANSLHPPHTAERPQACFIGRRPLAGSSEKQRGRRQPFIDMHLKRVPARKASSLHATHLPRTEAQSQACSIGLKHLTAAQCTAKRI